MSDLRCAACGLPSHRYGRNEGAERFDPMACINSLRAELDRRRRVSDEMVEAGAEAAATYVGMDALGTTHYYRSLVRAVLEAALGVGP